DPPQISSGESTRLSWKTHNAEKVEIFDEEDRAIPLGDAEAEEGSVEVRPEETTSYRLVATGKGKTAERVREVRVRGQPVVEAGLSATSILPGEAVTLS